MFVTGIEHCGFKNEKGEVVSFDRVTLLTDIPASKGVGKTADVINCSPDKTKDLVIGDEVEVLYNKYGKVSRFDFVG